jgi:ankyrin repeat protein
MERFSRSKDSLLAAVVRGDTSAVKNLLGGGANPNETDDQLVPVLMIAALNSDIATMEFLVKYGAKVDAVQENWTILMHATLNNQPASLEYLLRHGANPNFTDHLGTTALMIAALEGFDEIAQSLVESGATLDARDHRGNTALRNAELSGKPSMKRLLKGFGAIA